MSRTVWQTPRTHNSQPQPPETYPSQLPSALQKTTDCLDGPALLEELMQSKHQIPTHGIEQRALVFSKCIEALPSPTSHDANVLVMTDWRLTKLYETFIFCCSKNVSKVSHGWKEFQ